MMMNPSLTIVLLATLQIGCALKCNKCNACETTSARTEVCKDVDPLTEIAACLTQKVRIAHTPEPMTVKKCVTYPKGKAYQCVNLPDSDPYMCNVCHEDFCNSATTKQMNPYMHLFLLLLLPILFHH